MEPLRAGEVPASQRRAHDGELEATGIPWLFADPFDIDQEGWLGPGRTGCDPVASAPEGGMHQPRTDDVLFVGTSANLRRRLRGLASGGGRGVDVVLHRLFETVIAPAVRPEVLQHLVVNRMTPAMASMSVRDHVVFAFAQVGRLDSLGYSDWQDELLEKDLDVANHASFLRQSKERLVPSAAVVQDSPSRSQLSTDVARRSTTSRCRSCPGACSGHPPGRRLKRGEARFLAARHGTASGRL